MYTSTTNCFISNASKIIDISNFMNKNNLAVYNNALWKYSMKSKAWSIVGPCFKSHSNYNDGTVVHTLVKSGSNTKGEQGKP